VKRISILLLYLTPLGVLGYGIYTRPHVVEELASLIPSWEADSPPCGQNERVEFLEPEAESWPDSTPAPVQPDWANDDFFANSSNNRTESQPHTLTPDSMFGYPAPSSPTYDPNVTTANGYAEPPIGSTYPEAHALAVVDSTDPYAGTYPADYNTGVSTQEFTPPGWFRPGVQHDSATGPPPAIGESRQKPHTNLTPPPIGQGFPERSQPTFPPVGGMPPVTVPPAPAPIETMPVDPYAGPVVPDRRIPGPYALPLHMQPADVGPAVDYTPQEDPRRLDAVLQPPRNPIFPPEEQSLPNDSFAGSDIFVPPVTESPELTGPPLAEAELPPYHGEIFVNDLLPYPADQHQIRPLPPVDSSMAGLPAMEIPPLQGNDPSGGALNANLPPFVGGEPIAEPPPFEQPLLGGNDMSVLTHPVATNSTDAGPPMVIPGWGETSASERITREPDNTYTEVGFPQRDPREPSVPIDEQSLRERAITDQARAETGSIEGATVLANIGNDVLMACDVTFLAHDMADTQIAEIQANRAAQGLPPISQEDEAEARTTFVQQYFLLAFQERLRDKLFCADAKRDMPPEAIQSIEQQLRDSYNFEFLPMILEESGYGTRAEFAALLESRGSSLGAHRQYFMETQLAKYWREDHSTAPRAPTYDELYDYYTNNPSDFETVAKAQWEQLTISCPSPHAVNEEQAVARLSEMGDAVLNGTPFEDVARQASEGVTAARGGLRSWTSPGDLQSEPLNEAIFALPVGRLSRITRDDEGFHIVRVIEREEATKTPFTEAQLAIQDILLEEFKMRAEQDFLNRIAEEIPVVPSETIEEDVAAITGGTIMASNGSPQGPPRR
jgi:hypothetical protein